MGGSKSKEKIKPKKPFIYKNQIVEKDDSKYNLILDKFLTYAELEQGLRRAGLEACQLIVGIDFTKSNTWQGKHSPYPNNNLHAVFPYPNPYQQVLEIMCNSLAGFDDDNLIQAYGFGDDKTTDQLVFPFCSDQNGKETPCIRLEGVLRAYNSIIQTVQMSGPTSFAPIIYKAIEIVRNSNQYHILLIVCDGCVNNEIDTIRAIADASNYPLSIVCIGVGEGPWDLMEKFDDKINSTIIDGKIIERRFDNFQFVDFHRMIHQCENGAIEFAKNALMEIPVQYEYIQKFLLGFH